MSYLPEEVARGILHAALRENRAAELLDCLFEGGAATVQRDGTLALASGAQLAEMLRGGSEPT